MMAVQFSFSSAFLLGLMGLVFHNTHLLSALLCLEGMMISLFVAISFWTLQLGALTYCTLPIFFLAFAACEAGVGLALLVAVARTHATDHLQTLNLLQC